jgi:hypothetical protein
MRRDARHDVHFEPVRIGPVAAGKRRAPVPHRKGTGTRYRSARP